MAERRMFTQKITESDAFIEMPMSSQALYFHLCMNADDDGFVKNPKSIQRLVGCNDDDLKLLIAKRFILPFDTGVIVIKHWRMHNLLRKDRYKETVYLEEKSMLFLKNDGAYTLDESQGNPIPRISVEGNGNQMATNGLPNGNQMAPQDRIDKDSIGEDSIHTNAGVCVHKEKLTSFELNLNAFCKKWNITVDNYSSLIAELDFEKLNKAYSESTKFLQVAPIARMISWIIKNTASIYAGKYKDKKDGNGENKQPKGVWDDALDKIGRLD